MQGKLIFKDGVEVEGKSFGFEKGVAGEIVFTTGMVGYPESLTDPSYKGQLLVFTYPLIGNYGVPDKGSWESEGIKVSGVIVSSYNDTPSHPSSKESLGDWLKQERTPGLIISDTRFLTKKIRMEGAMLAKIVFQNENIPFYNPNADNLVKQVSTKKIIRFPEHQGRPHLVVIDCGSKQSIVRCLLERKINVTIVPWDCDPLEEKIKVDGVVISNGPGDPKQVTKTIKNIERILSRKIPVLGICLGNQILALATGGDTYKMKFGHRGQNQPCLEASSKRCFLTTQNHGFAIGKIPKGFKTWFINSNDGTNEGIKHEKYPFLSVQFHPEAAPGPTDTKWVFDEFLKFL
jgi:carbamoyl-phosphate synthase small subunit